MFRPITFFIALKSTKISFFARLVAISSQIGVALGVSALIVVMSVMNGYKQEMLQGFLTTTPHITLIPNKNSEAVKGLKSYSSYKFLPLQAVLVAGGEFLPIRVAATHNVQGIKNIIIPKQIMQSSELSKHQKLTLISNNFNNFFSVPKVKSLIVKSAIMPLWMQNFGYISQDLALRLNLIEPKQLPNIYLNLSKPEQAEIIANNLQKNNPTWQIYTWQKLHSDFFRLIATQKSMMFLVLFLITIIASFGLISGQVMLVQEKRREIAILNTMGLPPCKILFSFYLRGLILGVSGLILGLVLGLVIAKNVTQLVIFIEQITGQAWLSSALYGMDHMPSAILADDLWHITLAGLFLCVVSPLYPALIASRSEPMKVFRQQEGG